MKVALGQITSSPDAEENLRLVTDWSQQAGAQGADLIVFPEAAMMAFDGDISAYAENDAERIHQQLAAVARETGLTIVVGSFEKSEDGRTLNTLVAAQPDGTVTKYHKIHLYDAFGFTESKTIAPGKDPVTVDVKGTTVALTTCYDVRFPELYRTLASSGADLHIIAASWADGPGKAAQWDLLTRARALDTGTWLVAVDQGIRDPATEGQALKSPLGVGHSAAITPLGEECIRLGIAAQLHMVELDPAQSRSTRDAIGVLENAKLGER